MSLLAHDSVIPINIMFNSFFLFTTHLNTRIYNHLQKYFPNILLLVCVY